MGVPAAIRKGQAVTDLDKLSDADLAELREHADAFLPSRSWHLLDRALAELRTAREVCEAAERWALAHRVKAQHARMDASELALYDAVRHRATRSKP